MLFIAQTSFIYSSHRKLEDVTVTRKPHAQSSRQRVTSTYDCCTKPSIITHAVKPKTFLSKQIRSIPFSAICINKKSIGKGIFGKCYSGHMSTHLPICIKAFRNDDALMSVFPIEATLMLKLCHPNLPWLYGITEHGSCKMLVLSFHNINGRSCTLHKALHYDLDQLWFDRQLIDWKIIIFDVVSAVNYLHKNNILHNDIKSDNIVLDNRSSACHSVLIDFGKGCYANSGKKYSLSNSERRRYGHEHPQVAPDLRDGHCKQSQYSDVYSTGRIIKIVNEKYLHNSAVGSYGLLCNQYICTSRPSSAELFIAMQNLFDF